MYFVSQLQIQMQTDIFDYRNGKYQGSINSLKQRNGLGIFIDDDLTFHISYWLNNKLNGPTLVYLTHGKYIYGEWKMNEPHGLNIYRSGDTVLLSKFKQGKPSERCLLIFQKYNFACVLTDQNGEWKIMQSGPLPNHKVLIKYIEQIGLPFPQHYFSLTKFACTFSNNGKIKIFPCKTNYCYFGLLNGLGIIFNSNNGLVSVGYHQNQEISEYGGLYSGIKKSEEGNFQTGEVITYTGERPTSKIHSIFQKMHKKSLNFCNQYIDSKSRVFSTIEAILQNKLNEIAQQGRKSQQFKIMNFKDSLNYKQYNQEQSFKINENRQRMYSPPKKTMKRTLSNFQKASNFIEGINSHGNLRPNAYTKFNKTPVKETNHKQKQKNETNNDPRISISPYKLEKEEYSQGLKYVLEDNKKYFRRNPQAKVVEDEVKLNPKERSNNFSKCSYQIQRKISQQSNPAQRFDEVTFQNIRIPLYVQSKIKNKKLRQIYRFEGLVEQNINSSQQQQNLQQTSTFQKRELKSYIAEAKFQEQPNNYEVSNSPSKICKDSKIKKPSYEEIEQRRKRILRDFKQLNQEGINAQKIPKIKQSPVKLTEDIMTPGQSRESSCGFIPLSISNKVNKKSIVDIQRAEKQAQKFNKNSFTPTKYSLKQWNQNDENKNHIPLYSYQEQKSRIQKQNQSKVEMPQKNTTLIQNNLTPSKQKRTYQYVFE